MAFESGDVRGATTPKDKDHAWKKRPMNMLERSQNAASENSRASWDRMFGEYECLTCEHYSEILGQCHPTTKHECEQEQLDRKGCNDECYGCAASGRCERQETNDHSGFDESTKPVDSDFVKHLLQALRRLR
jgi:hypothetical protein